MRVPCPSSLRRVLPLLLPVMVVITLIGCGATPAASLSDVRSLRSRISELEAERHRQSRSVEDFEARLVALESRGSPRASERPELPVVRYDSSRAESESDDSDSLGAIGEDAEPAVAEAADGPRPVLKLHGAASPRYRPASGRRRPAAIKLASVRERLPVVPMPDAPPMGGGSAPRAATPSSSSSSSSSIAEVVARGRASVSSGQCGSVARELAQVISTSAEHPLADDAMLLRARCFRRQGAHLRAVGEVERLIRRYPRADTRRPALLLLAESCASVGDTERATETLRDIIRRYPGSPAAQRATRRLGELTRGARAVEDR